jgi:ribosomal-protein-alanine N-acetyltransferase
MNVLRALPMTPADLNEIMPLERRSFKDPWTRHMYLSDINGNHLATYLVLRSLPGVRAREASRDPVPSLLAYGGFWLLLDEAHIATIAAHPDWRGSGLGLWMLLELLDEAIRRGAALATLEVRVRNAPARRLYEKLGFEQVGDRTDYYRDGEDALIMTTPPLLDRAMQERLAAARAEAETRLEACFTAEPAVRET